MKTLLRQVENKTEEELLQLTEDIRYYTTVASCHGFLAGSGGPFSFLRMPAPLALATGIKPGFRTILRATYNERNRDPDRMAPLYPSYRTDFGWCSLVIPMVHFDERLLDLEY